MRLIITEKNNSAKKIADILSAGSAKDDATYKVPFYTWSDSEGDHRTVGLKGHVMGVAFPEEYSNWQKTDLHDLIDATLIPEPTDKNVVKAVRKLAKEADSVVIATDFDREGELIGHEALQQAMESNPEIVAGLIEERPAGEARPLLRAHEGRDRARILRARRSLVRARLRRRRAPGHRPDLGCHAHPRRLARHAALRLQLSLRRPRPEPEPRPRRRARARAPRPRAQALLGGLRKFEHPDGSFEAHHATDKFWDEAEANAALAGTKSPGVVKDVTARKNSRKPPTPLNTTAFTTDASSRLGITPASAMRIAEDLYMDGFISYPRTDNTVYPKSLNTRELVQQMVRIPEFEAGASSSTARWRRPAARRRPRPPADLSDTGGLSGRPRRGPEAPRLRARRAPLHRDLRAADDHRVHPRQHRGRVRGVLRPGSVVVDAGFAKIYTYARSSDDEIPALEAGQELPLDGEPWSVGKETQPPSRISQGKLIELMEERGLGTKATRADIIQKLYDRGYVYSNPPIPSETGIAMYKAFKQYVPRMATPEMTAELERDMDLIAAGEMTKDDVLAESREMLHGTTKEMQDQSEDLAKVVWAGMDEDKFLGPCEVCAGLGAPFTRTARRTAFASSTCKGGKRFWGCEGYNRDDPEHADSCRNSGPLPGRGYELWRLEESCSVCEKRPRLTVKGFRGRPWKLCLNDDCPTMVEMREKRAERQAQKEAREAAKAAAAENGEVPAESEGDAKASRREAARGRPAPKPPSPGTARTKKAGTRPKS